MKKLYTALFLSLLVCGSAYANNQIPYPDNYDIKTSGASSAYGLADVKQSPYFKAPNFYSMQSHNHGLTILSKYRTYQQSTEFTCGGAAALTVLDYYGNHNFDELQISQIMGTKYERDANGEMGTNTKQMVDFFKRIDWQVASSIDTTNGTDISFPNIADFAKFVQTNLHAGKPIMVESMYWGGHWRVIIGYDTMNTADMTDDVLIFADPYDTQDHSQDGYTMQTLAGFYYTWRDVDVLPKDQRIQQWLVAAPKK